MKFEREVVAFQAMLPMAMTDVIQDCCSICALRACSHFAVLNELYENEITINMAYSKLKCKTFISISENIF